VSLRPQGLQPPGLHHPARGTDPDGRAPEPRHQRRPHPARRHRLDDGPSPRGHATPLRPATGGLAALPRVFRLTIAYDGTAYSGWQSQPGRSTVQGLLAEAARPLLGDDVRLTGASRTDAGVHALGQTVSIRTSRSLSPDVVGRALNAALPR